MERDLLPVALHESHHHWFKAALNLFRGHVGLQTRFCWKQFAQMTEQGPQRGFNRLAVNFVLLELARTKRPDPAPFPSPVTPCAGTAQQRTRTSRAPLPRGPLLECTDLPSRICHVSSSSQPSGLFQPTSPENKVIDWRERHRAGWKRGTMARQHIDRDKLRAAIRREGNECIFHVLDVAIELYPRPNCES